MDPLIVDVSGRETFDTGAFRLRLLAQALDYAVAVTKSIRPRGLPGVVRHRHAQMADIFSVPDGDFVLVPPGILPHLRESRLGSDSGSEHPADGGSQAALQSGG